MNTRSEINTFLNKKSFALVGMSANPKKFSRMVYKELTAKGYEILPVNPKLDEIDGVTVYKSIADLPDSVDSALIMTPKKITPEITKEVSDRGIKNIWIQQGAHSSESEKVASELKGTIVHNKCVMMFADPVKGVHKFHRVLARIFGRMPA
jgi:predicted CoA-binding protein